MVRHETQNKLHTSGCRHAIIIIDSMELKVQMLGGPELHDIYMKFYKHP
jgi:hypothetical protein